MNAPPGLDLASIPERIQAEGQRAIQRSIKGVEYIASSGPSLGSTPKDVLSIRGTTHWTIGLSTGCVNQKYSSRPGPSRASQKASSPNCRHNSQPSQ